MFFNYTIALTASTICSTLGILAASNGSLIGGGTSLAARFTGGATQMIGSVIAANINLNPPVAAAFSMVPIAFVVMYLMVARRTGSLERM